VISWISIYPECNEYASMKFWFWWLCKRYSCHLRAWLEDP